MQCIYMNRVSVAAPFPTAPRSLPQLTVTIRSSIPRVFFSTFEAGVSLLSSPKRALQNGFFRDAIVSLSGIGCAVRINSGLMMIGFENDLGDGESEGYENGRQFSGCVKECSGVLYGSLRWLYSISFGKVTGVSSLRGSSVDSSNRLSSASSLLIGWNIVRVTILTQFVMRLCKRWSSCSFLMLRTRNLVLLCFSGC